MTGTELIAQERKEQIEKHGISIQNDIFLNKDGQLLNAARKLLSDHELSIVILHNPPKGWNKAIWIRMCSKPYKQRLIIAGALIAAELDKIQNG